MRAATRLRRTAASTSDQSGRGDTQRGHKPGSRLRFWGAALAALVVLFSGYVGLLFFFYRAAVASRPSRVDQELEFAVEDEPVGELLRLPRAAGRRTVTPEGVGVGWPALLGPSGDCASPERGLDLSWPESGPPQQWRIAVGTGYSSPVVLHDTVVMFHRQGDREVVDGLNAETGRKRWSFSWPARYQCPFNHSSGPYSTPVLEQGRLYAIGAAGDLYCLDLDDGREIWHRNLYDDYQVVIEVWPAAASPLLERDRLIINAGGRKTGAGIVAIDKTTGRTLWTATEDGASCSTPRAATIHGKRYVFVWTADALVALDPATGRVYWRIPFCANNHEAAHGTPPLIVGDIVVVSGYQVGNLCLRVLPDGGYRELWRDKRRLLDSQYNNLLHVDGHVCGFSAVRRRLRCLDLGEGNLKWSWRSKILNGTSLAVDGAYVLFGSRGRLASLAITAQGVQANAMTEGPLLAPPCLSYPALHNGLLYLRNEEELLCVSLRRSAPNRPSPPN